MNTATEKYTHPEVDYPPDPNPRKPRLKLPPGAWDTHFHIVGPPQRFPYVASLNYYSPAAPIEHYLALAEFLGFERGVVVQPRIHGTDPSVTLDAIAKSDGRLKGVIRADPNLDAAVIRRLHAAGVRGVRIELGRKLGGSYDKKTFDHVVSLAAGASWVVALHLDPGRIVELAEVIRRVPAPTILENYAKLDAKLGMDQPAFRTLLDLAQEPHIWLKTSSAYRMMWRGASWEQIRPIAKAVHAAAPDRTIWGTDWPHPDCFQLGIMPNDGDLVDTLLDYVPDETARRKLLVDNPKRLFDF
jgi:2-pyrone-4,6-dicarboxylate lactonase